MSEGVDPSLRTNGKNIDPPTSNPHLSFQWTILICVIVYYQTQAIHSCIKRFKRHLCIYVSVSFSPRTLS